MIGGWFDGLLIFFRTSSQILAAGIAITAFSLLLYALTFNLRDRVARSFALILICVVIVFTAEAIGSASRDPRQVEFWLRLQWVGIVFLPATYLQFADGLLATTGRPSRGKRRWAVRLVYLATLVFLSTLPFSYLVGPLAWQTDPAPYLQPTLVTSLFTLFYLVVMGMAWYVFVRAYWRTTTATSRRRMRYLITGALAPALGSFPYLLFSSSFAGQHSLLFWFLSALSNLMVGGLVVVMAYAVAFFGVSWPDRVVKSRLFKWIMRGPVTASITLGLVTVTRRTGEAFGSQYSALVPIVMVGSVLLCEYLITLFAPLWERILFYGSDRADLDMLRIVEERLLTRNDLQQFLEMVLAAVRDRLQAPGAYVVAMNGGGLELVVETGQTNLFADEQDSEKLFQLVTSNPLLPAVFKWGNDYLIPLMDRGEDGKKDLLGLLGIAGGKFESYDEEQLQSLTLLAERAAMALRDRRIQHGVFRSLQALTPEVDLIQRLRAAGRLGGSEAIEGEEPVQQEEMTQWVKDALAHYWGGPKLTDSPLLKLQVVQNQVEEHAGNQANALRSILREAIDRVKPEGERRFTGEWILYNILEMKFLEGRKVREIALRLAMSEADLYRKQRIAIEAVAKAIHEMEEEARVEMVDEQ